MPTTLWGPVLRHVALPIGDRIVGQRMMHRLRFLEEAQWWDQDRLHGVRDGLLERLLSVAYQEVPFYRKLFEDAGVAPADIRGAGDLSRLPVVTKDDLRLAGSRVTRQTSGRTHDACSSGSTGRPFCVKEDAATEGWHRASFLLAVGWSGWHLGERQVQLGVTFPRTTVRWVKDKLLRCHYFSGFDLSDAALEACLEAIDDHDIRHVWGYPGAVYLLARRAIEVGWNRSLEAVVTWGDSLSPSYRRVIEASFSTRVFDTYGCGEGMQIAAQCGRSQLYHVHTLDVIVEHLDDEGHPSSEEMANLVVTRLHPGPTPLIRYRIGDVGGAGKDLECECGRGYDLMESLQGRTADMIATPSGNRLIVHFFTGILEHFPEIDTFQVVQEEPDAILLRVVPRRGFSQETAQRVVEAMRAHGVDDLSVDVDVVDEIPVTAGGKRRFVINKADMK